MKSWNEVAAYMAKITDKLGMPIDSGIFDCIIALNVLGIPTSQSCEGHLDHGLAYPWISLGLRIRPYGTEYDKEETIKSLRIASKVLEYLAEFYSNRQVPYHRMLFLQNYAGVRICSHGEIVSEICSEDEKASRLLEYQDAMAPRAVPSVCACTPPISSSIPTATALSAIAVPCCTPPRPARPVTMNSFAKTKAVSRTSTSKPVARCASRWIGRARSTRASTTSAPPANASTARRRHWALSDLKRATSARCAR